MAQRSIGPNRRILAVLEFSGLTERGVLSLETRDVTGLTVTNNDTVPVGLEVEREDTKRVFGAVIQPGEVRTFNVPKGVALKWNTLKGGFWDGLNIRWKVPA